MKKHVTATVLAILVFVGTGYAVKNNKDNAIPVPTENASTADSSGPAQPTEPMTDLVPTETPVIPVPEIPESPKLFEEIVPEPAEPSADFMANIMNRLNNIEQRLVSIINMLKTLVAPEDDMEDVTPPMEELVPSDTLPSQDESEAKESDDMVDLDDSEQRDVSTETDLNEII